MNAYNYMLNLINHERRKVGVGDVTMGENKAAQIHANACLQSRVVSHWDLNGLKPYVRYSLTGGYQNNGENWFGQEHFGNSYVSNLKTEIDRSMEWLMNSPGHRAAILDRWYRKVNVGLAFSDKSFVAIQHFEGDFVEFERMPTIADGVLRISGRIKEDVRHCDPEDMLVDIWFDPPPSKLSAAQLLRVNGYDGGTIVGSLRRPLPPGYTWQQYWESLEVKCLRRPEDISYDSPEPVSCEERQAVTKEAYEANQQLRVSTVSFPLITAQNWTVQGSHFSITANIRPVTERTGPGIYSLMLWCPLGDQREMVNISRYSILMNLDWNYRRIIAQSLEVG